MAWELPVIWLIIAATTAWFIRDGRRQRAQKLDAMARHFATAAQWRHRGPSPEAERLIDNLSKI